MTLTDKTTSHVKASLKDKILGDSISISRMEHLRCRSAFQHLSIPWSAGSSQATSFDHDYCWCQPYKTTCLKTPLRYNHGIWCFVLAVDFFVVRLWGSLTRKNEHEKSTRSTTKSTVIRRALWLKSTLGKSCLEVGDMCNNHFPTCSCQLEMSLVSTRAKP